MFGNSGSSCAAERAGQSPLSAMPTLESFVRWAVQCCSNKKRLPGSSDPSAGTDTPEGQKGERQTDVEHYV
jgi:hypothetical protein